MLPIEWVLIGVVLNLGPYPVALKSYPEHNQCLQAVNIMRQEGRIVGDCVRVLLPRGIKDDTR